MKNGISHFLRWSALWLGCLAFCHGALAQGSTIFEGVGPGGPYVTSMQNYAIDPTETETLTTNLSAAVNPDGTWTITVTGSVVNSGNVNSQVRTYTGYPNDDNIRAYWDPASFPYRNTGFTFTHTFAANVTTGYFAQKTARNLSGTNNQIYRVAVAKPGIPQAVTISPTSETITALDVLTLFTATGGHTTYQWEISPLISGFSSSGASASLQTNTQGVYTVRVRAVAASGYEASPWAVSTITVSLAETITIPLPATESGDRMQIFQDGIMIAEIVRSAGSPAQDWSFDATLPLGNLIAVYGEYNLAHEAGTGIIDAPGQYLDRGYPINLPTPEDPTPSQAPIVPTKKPPTTPAPPNAPKPKSPTTGIKTPDAAPTPSPVVWSKNPTDHTTNTTTQAAVQRGTEINAEGLAKVVEQLKEHNEREKERQEAANELTDSPESRWTDMAVAAHEAAVGAITAPAEIFGDALSPGRGSDTAYTPPAPPSGYFTINTPFWGPKSINPFDSSADRLGGVGSGGRDWSVLADVTKAIIAWSTLFWLYYYILGEFKTAVADLFKVTTPTGEGAAISVILNQQVLGTNIAAAAIPAKLLLMAAGLAFWITVPAILLAALEGALTFSFDGSGTSSLVSAMQSGPSWMSAIWSLVSEVLPLATMITASATYALVRMGLITAQGTLSLVVRYISSMG